MKSILKNPVNLLAMLIMLIMLIMVLGCAEIPDELRDEARGIYRSSSSYNYYGYLSSSSSYNYYLSSSSWRSSSSVALCGGMQYNPSEQGCCSYTAFSLANQRCSNSVVETKCGSGWYNASSSNLRCQNNVVETKCGTTGWYNAANTNLRCYNSVVETKCGTEWYNVANASADCKILCGSSYYDPENQRCGTNNVIETLCGTNYYNTANTNLRCQSSVVEIRCGTIWYPHNFTTESCLGLTCASVPATGIAGKEITAPIVKCGDNNIASGSITWAGNPNWSNPVANTYSNVRATANCSSISQTANCAGTLTIGAALTCANVPTTGIAGTAITAPVVKCGDNNIAASSITWANNPNWSNPVANTYSNVRATATCGGSSQTASCAGSLTVSPALACANVPTTGIAGTAITAPTVSCGTTTVAATGITWVNAPTWNNPTVGTYSSVSATATCGNLSQTANCTGTLTVSPAPTLTCTSLPANGTVGTEITAPIVKCGDNDIAFSSITWVDAPTWDNPIAGEYSNVKAKATCGGTSQTADCDGTITIIVDSDTGG